MRLRDRDEPLDPEVERELDAMTRELAPLLADERPEPDPAWAGGLDERAASGFRDPEASGAQSPLASLRRFRPMQILAPAGALAAAAVIALVGVSTLSEPGGDESASQPTSGDVQSLPRDATTTEVLPSLASPSAGAATESFDSRYRSAEKIAPGTDKRQVERDVALTLSTRPEEVRDVSDEAVAITRSLGGIIASSQVSEAGGEARAALQLTIPSRNLDTAIDRLTDLANVKSLDEATLDITKPFASAEDRLRDAEAERRSLLKALANATTDAEAAALRIQIADARREIERAEAAFENIARRSRLSDVSLTVVGDSSIDEDRTIGDWFDDAVSVLRDVAGVLLISAAILVPLGILAGLGWWIVSGLRRRRRERALD